MSKDTIIKNVTLVNEGQLRVADLLIKDQFIHKIGNVHPTENSLVIDGSGKYLFPGIIDGQVHFRDPGLTHKGDFYTESKAAIAGGVTSVIDMPNTVPNVLSVELLEQKHQIAAEKSLVNYSSFLGVNADNINTVIQTDTSNLIGVSDDGLYFTKKGNLLADNPAILEKLFANCQSIIAIHAEKEKLVEENEIIFREKYGEDVPIEFHPIIRSAQGCFEASKDDIPLTQKRITTEVSVHHLWFSDVDYKRLGTLIKWNPAIKTEKDKDGLLKALLDDRIDIVTTDHAPHTLEEKQKPYFQAMSGAPIVQHSLNIMLEFYKQGKISLEKIAEKMCHNPATLYHVAKRGFIREGYFADLALVDLNKPWTVSQDNILYKCGWSPLLGTTFQTKVAQTFVNGGLVYDNGEFYESVKGQLLTLK
jgi:dihydroorotase